MCSDSERIRRFRRNTARQRSLPGALILGAQKAGTTSLFHYMAQHPQLLPAETKEVHYFDGGRVFGEETFSRGPDWYRSHFPLSEQLPEGGLGFEATPSYLFDPRAAERIHALIPEAKLIVLLRDPVERSVSQYDWERARGSEAYENIDTAFRAEESRLGEHWNKGDFDAPIIRLASYKRRGLYLEQLQRYSRLFPREQMLILGSADLSRNPASLLKRVFRFLEIDEDITIADLQKRNVRERKSTLPPATRSWLEDWFQPHNEALFAWLQEQPDW